jgi:hypothetical protein
MQLLDVGASEKMIFQMKFGHGAWRGHEILVCFLDNVTSAPEKRFKIMIGLRFALLIGLVAIQPPS